MRLSAGAATAAALVLIGCSEPGPKLPKCEDATYRETDGLLFQANRALESQRLVAAESKLDKAIAALGESYAVGEGFDDTRARLNVAQSYTFTDPPRAVAGKRNVVERRLAMFRRKAGCSG